MLNKDLKITIIGLGVLGGSYAKGFANAGIQVNAIDVNEESLHIAKENGWIKEGSSSASFVEDSDVVISCLYPHTFISWLQENQHYLKSGCMLTDVTGVKEVLLEKIHAFLRKDVEFIACHPMAGREASGLSYADEHRFESANFIIVPVEENTEKVILLARDIAKTLKFKHISVLTPQEHDRMIGFLSQLTHVIAVSLMNVADNPHLVDYTGDSFRDLTRIANINEKLWPELFVLNKKNLTEEIDAFVQEMNAFKDLLQKEDYEGMQQKMILSSQRRKMFDKK